MKAKHSAKPTRAKAPTTEHLNQIVGERSVVGLIAPALAPNDGLWHVVKRPSGAAEALFIEKGRPDGRFTQLAFYVRGETLDGTEDQTVGGLAVDAYDKAAAICTALNWRGR